MSIYQKLDRNFKILFLGDTSVGKTSLLLRYTENEFNSEGVPTLGVDVKYKYISFQNKKIRLDLWDTAGQERFRGIAKNYFRGAHGIIFVCDVTSKPTFVTLKNWIKDAKNNVSKDMTEMIIVGNKIDKIEEREIPQKTIEEFGEKNLIETFEASAKTGEGVEVFLSRLVEKLFLNGKIGIINKNGELEERAGSISLSKEEGGSEGGNENNRQKKKKDKKEGCGC